MKIRCADCRDGEHDNYDDDVRLVIIRDSNNPQRGFIKRCWMCSAHREAYATDGYIIQI